MTESAHSESRFARLVRAASTPVDARGLAVFRILFGLGAFVGALRFLINGWIPRFFSEPTFHFHYSGFAWVTPLDEPAMTAAFVVLCVLALMVAAGLFYRVAIVGVLHCSFTYVELIDVTYYLNHYYLVSLLALLLCFIPANRALSLDAVLRRRSGAEPTTTVPALAYWLLRGQLATVYFYAAMAKLSTDWLLHAQPMNIWLSSRTDVPVIGGLFDEWLVAMAFSWGGFLYDLTIPAFLLWRRTRAVAFAAVLTFHITVGILFPIGMFPVIMITAATLFFDPAWPARAIRKVHRPAEPAVRVRPPRKTPRFAAAIVAVAALWMGVQLGVPARHWLYPGDVAWNEDGMRWAWKVMVREKNGAVTYVVGLPSEGRTLRVPPSRYLTDYQEREMSGQPDLILQLAHHIGAEYRALGHDDVQVRADVLVSWNGRAPARLVDPSVDLLTVSDSWGPTSWVLPEPDSDPIHLRAPRLSAEPEVAVAVE